MFTFLCRLLPAGFGVQPVVGLFLAQGFAVLAVLLQPAGVVIQVPVKTGDSTVGHQPEFIHGGFQQVAVMGNHNHGAFKGLERQRQGFAHVQIQVVGRFIQYQQGGLFLHDHGQCQAGFFATGETTNGRKHIIAMKAEPAQLTAKLRFAPLGVEAGQHLIGRIVVVQPVHLLLVEVAHGQIVVFFEAAGQRGQLAYQSAHQCGFAGAVGAQQAQPGFRSQAQAHVMENGHIPFRVLITTAHLVQVFHGVG